MMSAKNRIPRRDIPYFATTDDFVLLVRCVMSHNEIQLVECGLFDVPAIVILSTPNDVMPMTSYLVTNKGMKVSVRDVPQRNGSTKFAIDAKNNPDSITIRFGGEVNGRLTPGFIGCGVDNEISKRIAFEFANVIKNKFEYIKSSYVGPEAVKMLDSGYRLSPTPNSSEVYDLCRD